MFALIGLRHYQQTIMGSGTNGPPCIGMHALGVGVWHVQPNCLKRPGTCVELSMGKCTGKDLLGSFVRVGYRIPVPDFISKVLHAPSLPKKHYNG